MIGFGNSAADIKGQDPMNIAGRALKNAIKSC